MKTEWETPTINAHKITDYVPAIEAAPLADVTIRTVQRLCADDMLEHYWAGHTLMVLKSDAAAYKRRAPGLKLGQKINRSKKK